jgi:hypothetical protein
MHQAQLFTELFSTSIKLPMHRQLMVDVMEEPSHCFGSIALGLSERPLLTSKPGTQQCLLKMLTQKQVNVELAGAIAAVATEGAVGPSTTDT